MVGGVLLNINLAPSNKHVHTHIDTNACSQLECNVSHFLQQAGAWLRNVFAQVQVLLDWSSLAATSREVDRCAASINIYILHTSWFEATESVKTVLKFGIDNSIAWAVSSTVCDHVNGCNFSIHNMELVLNRQFGADEFFDNGLGGLHELQCRYNIRVGHWRPSEQVNSTHLGRIWILNQDVYTLTGVEIRGLDDNTINIRWDASVQAIVQIIVIGDTAEHLRGWDIEISREQVSSHLVFEVVEPVTFTCYTRRIFAELLSPVLDQRREGFIFLAVVGRAVWSTNSAISIHKIAELFTWRNCSRLSQWRWRSWCRGGWADWIWRSYDR
mmetsp:Transcript_2594/g.4196  ORF Transcript_2594/g.4196 Transcript_2594/m.4196 type:complete len:328 (+) Transcript_2594:462-1445(+)